MLNVKDKLELLDLGGLNQLSTFKVKTKIYKFQSKNIVTRYPLVNHRRDPVIYDCHTFRCDEENHNMNLFFSGEQLMNLETSYSTN